MSQSSQAMEVAGIQYATAKLQVAAIDYFANYYDNRMAVDDMLELFNDLATKLTHPETARALREASRQQPVRPLRRNPNLDHCAYPWEHQGEVCVFVGGEG